MKGRNSVILVGYLMYPKLSETPNGFAKFAGKVAIPYSYNRNGEVVEGKNYQNICAYGEIAEFLGTCLPNTPIEINGHINSRSYDGKCKSCGTSEKKYWTEVQVDAIKVIPE